MANTALAIDQALKMGGKVITPPKKPTGFGAPVDPSASPFREPEMETK